MKYKHIYQKLLIMTLVILIIMIVSEKKMFAVAVRSEVMNVVLNPEIVEYKLNPNTEETYKPSDRKFQRMSSIVQYGSRIYAAWTAGGDTEPHVDNYIVVAYSDDLGHSWVDPYLVIDPLNYQSGDKAQLPSFWINPDGLLFLYYSCNKTGYKTIITQNADAENIMDVKWTEPRINNSGGSYTAPVTLKNGHVLMTTQGSNQSIGPVYLSVNKGSTWQLLSNIQSTAGSDKRFNESQIVELSDGTLMYLARLENPHTTGGLERSYSYDGGANWTETEYNLPYPLRGAGSRISFKKLKNGNLLLVTNDSNSTLRTNLTVFMSEDDGKTWPYKLLLDDREPVSYPDLAEGDDGSIVVIYDAGGNVGSNLAGLCEIRLARFFQSDLKNGSLVEPSSYLRGIISKSDLGKEIIEVKTNFENHLTFVKGTSFSDIIKNLPKTITVKLEDDTNMTFTGKWVSSQFSSENVGTYQFSFESEQWNIKEYQDNYSLLKLYVVIEEETTTENPKNNSIYIIVSSVAVVGVALMGLSIYILRKKKK
jgi:hypothetical protein